ncbi:MAG: hypothetical protein QOD03_239 [Verrucomicrobiota bacterium]
MKLYFYVPIVLAGALMGCSTGKKGDIVAVRDMPSPDGRHICTVFGETFHDTTGYRRHIYLRRAGEKLGYPANVYLVHVGDDVTMSWTSPSNLLVKLSFETPHAVPSTTNISGVCVTFEEINQRTPH